MNKALASRQVAGLTLGMVAVVVTVLTLFKNKVSFAGLWSTEIHNHRSIDLTLFNGWVHPTIWYGPITNTFGNLALFIPIGFLLMSLSRRKSIIKVVLAGAFLSLFIETCQYVFSVGYSDIDDLLFNTLGALVGGITAAKLSKRNRGIAIGVFLFCAVAVLGVIALTN